MPSTDAATLINQVTAARLHWHERSVRRLSAEDDVRKSRVADDDFGLTFSIAVRRPLPDDESQQLHVRGRLDTTDAKFAYKYEVTVTFDMLVDFPITDFNVLKAFNENVAFNYVLGFLRSAYLDGAQSMGMLNPALIPAVDMSGAFNVEGGEETLKRFVTVE
ncbi:hypothetical protein [Mycolicibacterium poriferae]|uniref:hypothetical protein n=1 Tax=Mycolicibacterium poriferae TaxID=39694 RepID=UPI0024BAA80C|nr:hypothetical protein [Mycolicibacterium poriferae]